MCYGCWEEYGKPSIVNELTLTAARAIDEVYSYSLSGGACHIVTDDWNLEDSSIQWCLDEITNGNARKLCREDLDTNDQLKCYAYCLGLLRELTLEERASAMAIHEKYIGPDKKEFKPSTQFTNPKYVQYRNIGKQHKKEEPDKTESHAPTLEWFLSLNSEQQNKIWDELREMICWAGWMSEGTGRYASDLFKALRSAGANWDQYT